ncbi:hypothetical protein HYDPIDRAFT_184574 [Hydnomerulius pinastri MD-312]|nr:hypothetical protein HYDPIDRAFT_184574 [Hydnomerulius pinastri MD-312]
MGGALNARPTRMKTPLPSVERDDESRVSESLSEREHREQHAHRLDDPSRLLDQPPQDAFEHADSYHSGHRERAGPDEPIVMSPSPRSRSSASGSDHTIDNLRTPGSLHPSERVIPPLPHHYSGTYVPGSKSPTDIYGGHPHEVAHEVRSYHNPEIYPDRYGRGHPKEGPIYYIIPGGMSVIFQDEHGNEITRVGDFSGRPQPSRPAPFIVQDANGRELYRYDGYGRGPHRGYSEPQVVRIDTYQPPSSRLRLNVSSVARGATLLKAIALTHPINGAMTTVPSIETIGTGSTVTVITEITPVIETTEATATTEIPGATETMMFTEVTMVTESKGVTETTVFTETMGPVGAMGEQMPTSLAECPRAHPTGRRVMLVKYPWKGRLASILKGLEETETMPAHITRANMRRRSLISLQI